MLRTIHNQCGDTIVEVLVAIAVISMVLAAAYATVNHNTQTTQDTQEHSQALQLAQTQVEYLRGATVATTPAPGGCFDDTGNPTSGSACVSTPNGSGTQPAFTKVVTSSGSGPTTYKVLVTWSSLVTPGVTNSVRLYYQR